MSVEQRVGCDPLFEVLTRQPNGHETVLRLRAKDAAAARYAVVEAGVPDDQIAEVARPYL